MITHKDCESGYKVILREAEDVAFSSYPSLIVKSEFSHGEYHSMLFSDYRKNPFEIEDDYYDLCLSEKITKSEFKSLFMYSLCRMGNLTEEEKSEIYNILKPENPTLKLEE